MSVIEKSEILSLVAGSRLSRRRALAQLGLAKSTYYRWLRRQTGGSLQDRRGGSPVPWNKLRPEEEEKIFALARALPELSSRELALRIVDTDGWYVSESTIFRALKREGLIKIHTSHRYQQSSRPAHASLTREVPWPGQVSAPLPRD